MRQAMRNGRTSANQTEDLAELQIPLPPLEVQKEIVAEIEGYQKVIDGARAVLDNYRPHIPIHPDWPMVELEEVVRRSATDLAVTLNTTRSGIQVVPHDTSYVEGQSFDRSDTKSALNDAASMNSQKYRFNAGDVLYR